MLKSNIRYLQYMAAQKDLAKYLDESFHIRLSNTDPLCGGKKKWDEAEVKAALFRTPIEELGIEETSLDKIVVNNVAKNPLFLEIKEIRNVTQPFQRIGDKVSSKDDAEEKEKKRLKKLKNQMYQLKAHDGKRPLKVILLFQDQDGLIKSLCEGNKFILKDAFVSPAEPNTLVVDFKEQLVQLYADKKGHKIKEEYQIMQGLPLKYTSAPRFVFLNESAGFAGEKQQQERDDEFADLFKQFDVPDLTSSERTYIKRFEQLGFWRKKFIETKKE